jgi:hypothetical protein
MCVRRTKRKDGESAVEKINVETPPARCGTSAAHELLSGPRNLNSPQLAATLFCNAPVLGPFPVMPDAGIPPQRG